MSLNYGTLKTEVLAQTHRTGLTDAQAASFVRQAEGVIARRLRATEMITRVDLTDSDRVTADEGFYSLPSNFLEARAFFLIGSDAIKLEPVSLDELRRVAGSSPVRHYTIISDGEVEFRGVPSSTAEVELIYFARPTAFSDDGDTNDILTNHEIIYLAAAKSALYEFTQDLELAEVQAQIAGAAIEALNEQAGRMIGGANTHGYYCLSSYGSY